jgi:anti-sigma regulatory factor (Ser/Thr protein kinase)
LHLEEKGILGISISRDPGMTKIIIEDNGIGREKAALFSATSAGKGLQILRGYFDYFNLYHHEKSDFYFDDLKNSQGEARGTKITVLIPDGMNYTD